MACRGSGRLGSQPATESSMLIYLFSQKPENFSPFVVCYRAVKHKGTEEFCCLFWRCVFGFPQLGDMQLSFCCSFPLFSSLRGEETGNLEIILPSAVWFIKLQLLLFKRENWSGQAEAHCRPPTQTSLAPLFFFFYAVTALLARGEKIAKQTGWIKVRKKVSKAF